MKIAANGGDQQAQRLMGKLYENGVGVSKSLELAIFWYQKAGETGDADRCRKMQQA